MKINNNIAIGILLVLTIVTAFVSMNLNLIWVVLGISVLKFITVAFQFMELKTAHPLWKNLLIGYLVLFVSVIYFILS